MVFKVLTFMELKISDFTRPKAVAFFTYLYGISILFLLYVFCYLLSGSTRELPSKNQFILYYSV
ncbi:hypothetical protein Anas_02419 [Armadillidium nasatum]|uniref:Uncharacterized protein n=1 Tax=Armadillidium nasatum TaxID=96803 RepID=A0A5N5TND8_9CRUS|nr:hypothetical protein Anas_02419 [Armadillidium nasatum]